MAEGKMPDAAEWAPRFVTSYYSLGVDQVTPLLADFQREILLAAAQEIQEYCASYDMPSDRIIGLNTAIEMLERLAEGRQP